MNIITHIATSLGFAVSAVVVTFFVAVTVRGPWFPDFDDVKDFVGGLCLGAGAVVFIVAMCVL